MKGLNVSPSKFWDSVVVVELNIILIIYNMIITYAVLHSRLGAIHLLMPSVARFNSGALGLWGFLCANTAYGQK